MMSGKPKNRTAMCLFAIETASSAGWGWLIGEGESGRERSAR
ncbi:hypothetical protein HMPREF9622_00923 [Cutibacterium modestum HL037PA3]|nr:hypothetical protein HMPREF9621_00537 [Cutibacterium modestum HL037PA2]EFT16063.1 hypothetical protein HMPREF9622_00923 [Cutibacterium modestum HL037PA3]